MGLVSLFILVPASELAFVEGNRRQDEAQTLSEEQIIGILKATEVAGNIRSACKENNISEQTFYRWRNKYGGMEVSEVKRLRALERENTELKKRVAELSLDNRMLKDLNSKKW